MPLERLNAAAVALLWAAVIGPGPVAAQRPPVTIPDDGMHVLDRAGLLDPQTQRKLEGWLTELEQKTSSQVKLLTVPSTAPEDVFDFAQRHFDAWKLGQQRQDNGALIVLALQERRIRIHTGYGLEEVLPDSWCGETSRDVAMQYFRVGRYAEGLDELVIRVVNAVAQHAGVAIQGVPERRPQANAGDGTAAFFFLLLILILLMVIFSSRQQRRRTRQGYDTWTRSGGWGTSFGGGAFGGRGGFGGGGFGGGFGGGGSAGGFGGSFGGGGRSGGGGGGASW